MKRGQTIAASREKLQSASERLQVREQQKRKKNFRLGLAISGAAIVVALLAAGWYNLTQSSQNTAPTKFPRALKLTPLSSKLTWPI